MFSHKTKLAAETAGDGFSSWAGGASNLGRIVFC